MPLTGENERRLPRANDTRFTDAITASLITPTGNFIDDVKTALEALTSTTGSLDDLWKRYQESL